MANAIEESAQTDSAAPKNVSAYSMLEELERHDFFSQAAAYHEAGHAVAYELHGRRVSKVSIVEWENDPNTFGITRVARGRRYGVTSSLVDLEHAAVIALAGPEAERRFLRNRTAQVKRFGVNWRMGAEVDLASARRYGQHHVNKVGWPVEIADKELLQYIHGTHIRHRDFLRKATIRAREFVRTNKTSIRRVAKHLLDEHAMDGRELRKLLGGAHSLGNVLPNDGEHRDTRYAVAPKSSPSLVTKREAP